MPSESRRFTILVVEDEPVVARRVERLTSEILGDRVQSIIVCPDFRLAEEVIDRQRVDLLLLDLNLSGRNGFELLHRAVARAFHTVVISANIDRAIEAFDYGVVDFVPKPFGRERLARAFERALRTEEGAGRGGATTLAVKKRGAVVMVPIAEILYIRGAGPYSDLIIRGGRVELHDKSLDALMCVLPPSFHRTHKSYVVPLTEIDRLLVHEGTRYEVVLRSGERLPVGRSRYQALRQRLGLER